MTHHPLSVPPFRLNPAQAGPDCPVCELPGTRWQGIDSDHPGDAWSCPAGHAFLIDPEGFFYVPPAGEAG